MSIETHIRHVNGITIFDLHGHMVTGTQVGKLRETLLRAYERGNRWILLNCEDLGSVDSGGMGELVGAYATIIRRGGVLRLLNPSHRLVELLTVTGLDDLFEIHDDELIALASFNKSGSARAHQKLADYLDAD